MKRLTIFVLTLVILGLAACSAKPDMNPPEAFDEPETTTTATTTVLETTTEEARQLPERLIHTELALSDTITVFTRLNEYYFMNWPWGLFVYEIWMRDEAVGEETILLETIRFYDAEICESVWNYLPMSFALHETVISERVFSFTLGPPESGGWSNSIFYDIELRQEIEIADERSFWFREVGDGRVYLRERICSYDADEETIYYIEISALESGEPVIVNEVQP